MTKKIIHAIEQPVKGCKSKKDLFGRSIRRLKMTEQQSTVNMENLAKLLEPLIRRVIREELAKLAQARPDIFFIDPEMPVYNDMENIIERDKKGTLKLHSHEEVWGE
eukprot:gnl/Chilomastix_cuspidata/9835.p2 GENE.gnl/Chilomastix_cuspidata/9835~~gnl/Chilomastix_cuspidata/9835.p2  ORF type:complete len:107 (-),score=1.56 gnl/Chilomastix_cuspidata/9835:315-635(-)